MFNVSMTFQIRYSLILNIFKYLTYLLIELAVDFPPKYKQIKIIITILVPVT